MTTSLKNPLSSVFHLISVSWTTLLSLLSSPRVTMHRRTDCTSLLNLELIWNVYNVNIDKIWPEIDLKYVDCSFPQSYSWAPKAWHQPSCHWRKKSNINNQNIPFLDKFFSPMLMQLSVSGPRWGRISCKSEFMSLKSFPASIKFDRSSERVLAMSAQCTFQPRFPTNGSKYTGRSGIQCS